MLGKAGPDEGQRRKKLLETAREDKGLLHQSSKKRIQSEDRNQQIGGQISKGRDTGREKRKKEGTSSN